MIEQLNFFNKYNIKQEDFNSSDLNWEDLMRIYSDYQKYRKDLESSAIYLFTSLMKSPNVHSVRYRIKDPEHLIEKIIRKKIENNESNITLDNYKDVVTDLIGLRALHLYKEDWESINDYIISKWNLKQIPTANYREGDSEELIRFYGQKGCEIRKHKYGYRSVHYIIETQPAKYKVYSEIQVRTIFEEAWAEIDHTIRYPYDLENIIFSQFLLILNRLAGGADEMGSYIKFLKKELTTREADFNAQLEEKSSIISNLEERIEKLNLKDQEVREVKSYLEKLKSQKPQGPLFTEFYKLQENLDNLQRNENMLMTLEAFRKATQSTKLPSSSLPISEIFNNMNKTKNSKDKNIGDKN